MNRLLIVFAVFALACAGQNQQSAAPKGAPKGPPAPTLMDCGVHGDIDILCGARSPEDLELTPDNKYLLVPQFVNAGGAGRGGPPPTGLGIQLFDISKKTFSLIPVTDEPRNDWGDASCPGPIGDKLVSHGISLNKRNNGMWELYVVNHGGGRQSMEMFELKQTGGMWGLIWHGCVVSKPEFKDYNDVAALPDGSFIATHPTALQPAGPQAQQFDLFSGIPSGFVGRWIAGEGEKELPNTRVGYPNGVLVSADGRYMYVNAWTAKEVHKYDLKDNDKELGMAKLDFMPDNITWTAKHQMLAAGVKGARGDCPSGSGTPCQATFGVALIDPITMRTKATFDSTTNKETAGKPPAITGVSVALEVGNSMYIGAFSGNRLVKLPMPKEK